MIGRAQRHGWFALGGNGRDGGRYDGCGLEQGKNGLRQLREEEDDLRLLLHPRAILVEGDVAVVRDVRLGEELVDHGPDGLRVALEAREGVALH